MKHLIIMGMLGLALSTSVMAREHEHARERGQQWLTTLKQLNLSEQQREEIKLLLQDGARTKGKKDMEQRLALAKQRHAIYQVLTEEQQQALNDIEQTREKRHAEWTSLREAEQSLIRKQHFDEQAWRDWYSQAEAAREKHEPRHSRG